jgi:inward rectifier potassium channel
LPRESSVTLPVRATGQAWAPQEDLYHYVLTRPWWQFFAFTSLAYILTNMIFAGAYLLRPGSILNAREGSFQDAFFFSVQTMATIGYGAMAPASLYAHLLVTLEAILGMLGVALVTGITFAKFARPQARVLFASRAVICNRDGVPHLMFRMANWRHNQIAEAQLRVFILRLERTKEGETLRVPLEIPLVRSRSILFILSWTALHRIDENSPFQSPEAIQELERNGDQIFLMLHGTDETLAQPVSARYVYKPSDIVWGARFADVLTIHPDGTREIDYYRFHEVIPVDMSEAQAAAGGAGAAEQAAVGGAGTSELAAAGGGGVSELAAAGGGGGGELAAAGGGGVGSG